jgi:hypothetical protein
MNQIEKSCHHCGKKYTKLAYYKKHFILCEIIHKTEKEREEERETQSILSNQTDLIKVVQHLVRKCGQLETKIDTIASSMQKEKKKIDILDWLHIQKKDSPHYPDLSYADIQQHTIAIISQKHIEQIQDYTFMDGLRLILEESFQNRKPPFYYHTEKKTIYLCESLEPLTWKEYEKNSMIAFFNGIQKRLLFLHGEWKKHNRQLFENDDRICERYNKTMMKMLISFKEDANYRKAKQTLILIPFKKV